MYCEWCGHQYLQSDKYRVNRCVPCASRYNRYLQAKKVYRHKPSMSNLTKLVAIQTEYKELAANGYKVPADLAYILKGG